MMALKVVHLNNLYCAVVLIFNLNMSGNVSEKQNIAVLNVCLPLR